jgi:hypothetical protein
VLIPMSWDLNALPCTVRSSHILRPQHRCLLVMRCMTRSAADACWSSPSCHRLQWPTLSTYQLASPDQGGSTA